MEIQRDVLISMNGDSYYIVRLEESDNSALHSVVCYYGKINRAPKKVVKIKSRYYEEAFSVYKKTIKEKRGKGYKYHSGKGIAMVNGEMPHVVFSNA